LAAMKNITGTFVKQEHANEASQAGDRFRRWNAEQRLRRGLHPKLRGENWANWTELVAGKLPQGRVRWAGGDPPIAPYLRERPRQRHHRLL